MPARDPRAHLLLVGSGEGQALSVEAELRERVEREGLVARVTFAGRVDDVEDYLRASDVFAFPSVFEALGLSLIEAAACGLPAVGSRTGGIVDVIEDGRVGPARRAGRRGGPGAALERLLADEALGRGWASERPGSPRARFDFAGTVVRYRCLFAEVARRVTR